jgi:hypothetical protein
VPIGGLEPLFLKAEFPWNDTSSESNRNQGGDGDFPSKSKPQYNLRLSANNKHFFKIYYYVAVLKFSLKFFLLSFVKP